jgi:hypothetical protein
MLEIKALTCREFYNIMVMKIMEKPTTEAKIQEILAIQNINWCNVYTLIRNVTIDNYSRIFHFKLSHNILYLSKILHIMGISGSPMCLMSG